LTFEPGNVLDLRDKINTLLADPGKINPKNAVVFFARRAAAEISLEISEYGGVTRKNAPKLFGTLAFLDNSCGSNKLYIKGISKSPRPRREAGIFPVKTMGENARRVAEKEFSAEGYYERLSKLYNRVIGDRIKKCPKFEVP
jgi:glycosyltransferase involved in cell wall biosynthesis